ncbi:RloB family protein [Streptomyces mayteni]
MGRGKRGRSLDRRRSSRPEQRRFLLYCEGECTETQYFKGLRRQLRALPVAVEIGPEHGEPKSLVRAAIDHKERAHRSAADRYTAYDEVWCVMDVEAPVPHPTLGPAISLARANDVGVVLSNPCFELWLALHFTAVGRNHTSGAMQQALEKLAVCGYSAGRKHLDYDALRGRYEQARERAQESRRGAASVWDVNPATDVDRLVDLLLSSRYG